VDVESYEIWIDAGDDLTSDFRKLAGAGSYNGVDDTYTIQKVADTLGDPGTIYRIKILAKNEDAVDSLFSDELVVALGSVPSKPSKPTKNILASGAGQIAIDWAPITTDTLHIFGYRLYSDLG
jgi:hypothetical protein